MEDLKKLVIGDTKKPAAGVVEKLVINYKKKLAMEDAKKLRPKKADCIKKLEIIRLKKPSYLGQTEITVLKLALLKVKSSLSLTAFAKARERKLLVDIIRFKHQ